MTPTFHDWPAWVDPKMPVVGPNADWTRIDTAVPHYTAADDLIDGDPGEHADQLDEYIRAIHRDYTVNRGYSIGYNFAVDWLGGVWRLRGWDIKCAANKGHNDHAFAILCLVDGADPVTPEAAAAIRWLVGEGERRARRPLKVIDHGRLAVPPGTPTACAGAGIRRQVDAGLFSPAPTPPEDPDMANPVKYLRVRVPGDPTRAEALVLMSMQGFATNDQQQTVVGFHAAEDRPVTAAQYDALKAVYTA